MDKNEIREDFVYTGSWFHNEYSRAGLDGRGMTFEAALNIFLQRGGTSIVETGCQREENDFGAGMSTTFFCRVMERYDCSLTSVDNNKVHLKRCQRFTKPWHEYKLSGRLNLVCSCSVKYFEELGPDMVFDLVYLDSYDYPYGEILNEYGGKVDIEKAERILKAIPEAEVIEKHGHLFKESQDHALREVQTVLPHTHKNTVILIDDNNFPGGGKSRLAKRWLANQGWLCVLDYQQTLWIKA